MIHRLGVQRSAVGCLTPNGPGVDLVGSKHDRFARRSEAPLGPRPSWPQVLADDIVATIREESVRAIRAGDAAAALSAETALSETAGLSCLVRVHLSPLCGLGTDRPLQRILRVVVRCIDARLGCGTRDRLATGSDAGDDDGEHEVGESASCGVRGSDHRRGLRRERWISASPPTTELAGSTGWQYFERFS